MSVSSLGLSGFEQKMKMLLVILLGGLGVVISWVSH